MANVWDQTESEPGLWYDRFERYRLMGPSRTIEATHDGDAKESKGKRPSRHWYEAAKTYEWQRRAEAWDASLRDEARRVAEEAYRGQLDKHRDNAVRLAQATMNNTVRILQLTSDRLKAVGEGKEVIPLKLLPGLINAAAKAGETALNSEAQALAVDQLLRQMEASDGTDGG